MENKIYRIIKDVDGHHLLKYRQFTIDLIEECVETVENDDLNEETMAGSVSYKIYTALEIMDRELDDYAFLEGLLTEIRKEYKKY